MVAAGHVGDSAYPLRLSCFGAQPAFSYVEITVREGFRSLEREELDVNLVKIGMECRPTIAPAYRI